MKVCEYQIRRPSRTPLIIGLAATILGCLCTGVWLTVEAARAAGLEVSTIVLTPWPAAPTPVEASNLETIAELAGVRPVTLPRLDLRDPSSWPGLPLSPAD